MAQQHINRSSPNDGLGDTLYNQAGKIEENFNELYTGKVDKITGYGLSENDFTDADKAKLDSLDPDAGAQSDWNAEDSGDPSYILNKPLYTSDFNNDGDGTALYVPDVLGAGSYVRQAGAWVEFASSVQPVIMDAIIGVTVGFVVGQQVFSIPAGAKCIDVWLSHAKQYKTTANNTSLTNRWSQTGNDVTITKVPVLNNYLYIEYIL